MALSRRRPRPHPSLTPVARRRPKTCNPLHLSDKFFLVIIATDADSHESKPPLQLHLNNLKPTPRLYSPLPADMNPFDVVERNHPLLESILEDESVLHDNQLSVTNPIRNQRNERAEYEEHNNIENGIPKDERKPVFNEIPPDASIHDQRDKINQCLLIIKIELVSENLPVLVHTQTYEFGLAIRRTASAIVLAAPGFPSDSDLRAISPRRRSSPSTSKTPAFSFDASS